MDINLNEVSVKELFEAQALVWSSTLSFIKSMSLKCALELGIPDIIHNHGKPITLPKLISSLSIDPSKSNCIHSLMRILIHSGFFIKTDENLQQHGLEQKEEAYSLTVASQLLLKDGPLRVTPFSLANLDPVFTTPWNLLSTWLKNGNGNGNGIATPFEMASGKSLWDIVAKDPKFNNLFSQTMATDSQIIAKVITNDIFKTVFEGLKSLIDVGGSKGIMAKAIAQKFPNIDCFVLDLPHVVANLEGTHNLNFIGGDMFKSIPPKNGILLKWILHNWNDEECLKILKNCREALVLNKDGEGRVIIIDMVIGNNNNMDNNSIEAQLYFDMLMMFLLSGKQRDEKDWEKLFLTAGFNHYKITPIFGPRSLIELYL